MFLSRLRVGWAILLVPRPSLIGEMVVTHQTVVNCAGYSRPQLAQSRAEAGRQEIPRQGAGP